MTSNAPDRGQTLPLIEARNRAWPGDARDTTIDFRKLQATVVPEEDIR